MNTHLNLVDHPQSDSVDWINLTFKPIDSQLAVDWVKDPSAGSVATFIGTTRDTFKGKYSLDLVNIATINLVNGVSKRVKSLFYESYAPMAIVTLENIIKQTRIVYPSLIKIAIIHKLGACPVGEESVVIAVSSPHRKEGLEAVERIINQLKAKVEIWKREEYEDGSSSLWKGNCECQLKT